MVKDDPLVALCETGLRYTIEKGWLEAALTGERCGTEKTRRRRKVARTQRGFKNSMLPSYY